MIHRIGRKKYDIYAMDIESHNDEESIRNQVTSMWLGCFINEESKVYEDESYFYNMDEFLDRLNVLSSRNRKFKNKRPTKNICVYIYNLSFEWSFLLPYVLKRGFKFKEMIDKDDEMVFNSISTKSVSSVWQVQLKFGKKDGIILLRDLAKIYGGGLGAVAKAFKLPTQKGEIDYRLNRLHNYTIKCYERIYCFKDTRIIIDILLKEIAMDDKDFFRAVSMASYSMLKLLKTAYPRKMKPYKEYRKLYPELGEKENEFVRKSLSGGICYATRNYQFKEINQEIIHIDAHQMYPSQVYLKPHPYGYGEYFKGKPTKLFKHINCCHIKVSYDDVLIHSVVQLIGQDFIDGRELYVWDFEIPIMYKCYVNLEIEYIDGYCYKSRFLPWREFVNDNYHKRLEAKRNGDAYNTLRYKLMNNSSAYGKFVEKPHNIVMQNTINEYGIIDSIVSPKDDLKFNAKYTYIPLATIPARGRVELISRALDMGWRNVLYFDTDSIFAIYNDETKEAWSKINQEDALGGWALEEIACRGQFSASKRYKLEVDTPKGKKTTIKAGGINFDAYKQETHKEEYERLIESGMTSKEALSNIEIPFDEVNIISSTWKVQRAYRVRGGTIIEFQEKTMDIQKKYLEIYKKNSNI